jgi:hypothetical protein
MPASTTISTFYSLQRHPTFSSTVRPPNKLALSASTPASKDSCHRIGHLLDVRCWLVLVVRHQLQHGTLQSNVTQQLGQSARPTTPVINLRQSI